jgi:DNA polymerase III subunit gamma/tau
MAYTVLARRYRSTSFDEVIGQEPIARTLRSAIEQNRVAHAYLFCGTRGVGKTTMARILARALNCEKGPTATPCGTCDICQSIHRGDDVDVLEIDGASNTSVEDVRILRENAHYRPARGRFKIYYIDEVHMLSRSAFNALLKTLEEPPEHVKFIFSTTEPERLPATILSRCQRFDFRAVSTERITEHLADLCKREKVKAEADALLAVAREGRGSVRDALTLLDQAIAVGDGKVTLEAVRDTVGAVSGDKVLAILAAGADGQTGQVLSLLNELLAAGADIQALLEQLMRQVRDLLVVKTCGAEVPLLDVFGPDRKAMAAVAAKLSTAALVAALGYLAEARNRSRWVVDARPVAELALVRLASLAEMEPLPEVLARLESLEQSFASGAPAPSSPERKLGVPPGRSELPRAAAPAPSTAVDEKKNSIAPPRPAGPVRPEPQAPPAPPEKTLKPDGTAADPIVQKTMRLFDGRIVSSGGEQAP